MLKEMRWLSQTKPIPRSPDSDKKQQQQTINNKFYDQAIWYQSLNHIILLLSILFLDYLINYFVALLHLLNIGMAFAAMLSIYCFSSSPISHRLHLIIYLILTTFIS